MYNIKKYKLAVGILIIFIFVASGCSYQLDGNEKFNSQEVKKLCEEKSYDEAMKKVNEYLKEHPDDRLATTEKGYILISSGKNEEGLMILIKQLDKYPKDHAILNDISWAYNNLHLYKMANSYIDRALKNSPNSDNEYVNKGNAQYGLKNYDEAIKYFNKALVINSKNSYAIWGNGLCLYEKKQYRQCIDYFKKYSELRSDGKSTNYYITSSYIALKDFDGAINEYKTQINNNPNNYVAYGSLGDVYRQQGDYKSALDCYEIVIKKYPDDADTYYEMGICFTKLGKKDDACESLKLAIKYDEEYIYDIQDEKEFDVLRGYDKFEVLLKLK